MFTVEQPDLEEVEVILFASPEQRCLYGIENLGDKYHVCRVWIVSFLDSSVNQPSDLAVEDLEAVDRYQRNLSTLMSWAEAAGSEVTECHLNLNLLEDFDSVLGSPNPFTNPLIVDISCAPRGHLFALLNYLARCQIANLQQVVLMYSLVARHSHSEDDYSYGMQDVAVVPGYPGTVRIRKDYLVILLGFEGNRAFSLYRRLDPSMTTVILGDTGSEFDREHYFSQASKNNASLIALPSVSSCIMPSRDLYLFVSTFDSFLDEVTRTRGEEYNIYFSCLGTKLQTVGAFLVLQKYPSVQVVDALPTRRRISTDGVRSVTFADFSRQGLLDTSILSDPDS
jgi:hypothetical protein